MLTVSDLTLCPRPVDDLPRRIAARECRVGVIGLGYVGLPLAVSFASCGFEVIGLDSDAAKTASVNAGHSYIPDVASESLADCVSAGRLNATDDMSRLAEVDVIDICVPTPLRKTRDPDLTYVVNAVEAVARVVRPGQLIILESTTYPGTTTEIVQPMLERTGLRADVDFLLAFSPERVDPGNQQFTTATIPKVVGGVGPNSTRAACALYAAAVEKVVPVSSPAVAEMVKLLENTFRAVNIGLVNELAQMCRTMHIDVWEVIEAAATKPFGFMPFYPGPGLGGHCIPIDPFYLSWKARENGFECRFIELAGHVNGSMPEYVLQLVGNALNAHRKSIRGSRVHLFGVAYKRDVGDVRESPALDIIALLTQRGAIVSYTDPYVPRLQAAGTELGAVPFDTAVSCECDCAIVVTDHRVFDFERIACLPLVVDTRNSLKSFPRHSIVRL
jgi:UDP-N-acetyl-D-glucosamine dehydrogenase